MTPRAAVGRGFLTVMLPAMVVLFSPMLVALKVVGLRDLATQGAGVWLWAGPALLIGFVGSWLVWSIQVPRWRLWAYQRVDDLAHLKRLAVVTGLIWPEGIIFERTEIASPHLRQQLRDLEASKSNTKPARN